MSIENAIMELAAALRYHADKSATPLLSESSINRIMGTAGNALPDPDAELEAAVKKVEADAKPAAGKAAVAQALADAKAEKEKAAAPAPVEEPDDGLLGGEDEPAKVLDWKADVMPVLQQVGKDKDKLAGLLSEFGVGKDKQYKTANLLPADVYPALLGRACKLLDGLDK